MWNYNYFIVCMQKGLCMYIFKKLKKDPLVFFLKYCPKWTETYQNELKGRNWPKQTEICNKIFHMGSLVELVVQTKIVRPLWLNRTKIHNYNGMTNEFKPYSISCLGTFQKQLLVHGRIFKSRNIQEMLSWRIYVSSKTKNKQESKWNLSIPRWMSSTGDSIYHGE